MYLRFTMTLRGFYRPFEEKKNNIKMYTKDQKGNNEKIENVEFLLSNSDRQKIRLRTK